MTISEQVKELKDLADISGVYGKLIIQQAANTIEILSARLEASCAKQDVVYIISEMVEEIEYYYGQETELTERAKNFLSCKNWSKAYCQDEIIKVTDNIKKDLIEQHNKAYELIDKMPISEDSAWFSYVGGVMQTLGALIASIEPCKLNKDTV